MQSRDVLGVQKNKKILPCAEGEGVKNELETIYEEIHCTVCDAFYEDEQEAWTHAEKFRDHRLLGKKLAITEAESEYEITFWIPPFEGYFPREKYE